MSDHIYLAVYGTLRGNMSDPDPRLAILKGHAMYSAGGYPVIFHEAWVRPWESITVEVCKVTEKQLEYIDRYEDISGDEKYDLYKRTEVTIEFPPESLAEYYGLFKHQKAFAYVGTEAFRRRKLAKIPSGDWLLHQQEQKNK